MTAHSNQYLAALVVNMLSVCHGIAAGWASPNLLLLLSDKTPLPTGKISMDDASWIAALMCVGGFFGNIFFGFITNHFGRKGPLLVLTMPAIFAWLLILYAQDVYFLYLSRMIVGFVGGGIFVILPLFLSEIANDSIRGALGSTIMFTYNIGILIAFLLGNFCDYYTTPKLVLGLAVLFPFLFNSFPETPSYLFKQKQTTHTEKSIRFYCHIHGKTEELQTEINNLKTTFGSKIKLDNGLKWSDFSSKEARKAMIIGAVLAALQQLCGCFAMLNYTAKIFQESGSNLPPNVSAIVVGIIQLFGSSFSIVLADRAGRKLLYVCSSFGTALGLIALGTFMMLKTQGYAVESFNWIPIISFSFVIFIASWAVLTLPFLVISEIMPEKLKNFGSSFCTSLIWVFAFLLVKFLPLLSELLGMHGSFFLFATFSIAGGLFVIFMVPETKGKSYQQIMETLQ